MKAFTFEVMIKRLGGGSPAKTIFYVSAPNETLAQDRLAKSQGLLDERVTLVRELTASEVTGLGLVDGEVRAAG